MQYLRALVVLLVAVAWTTSSDATVIDSFNNGWGLSSTVGGGEGTTNDNAGPFEDILGGTRKASVKFTGDGATSNVRFTVDGTGIGEDGRFLFLGRDGPTATGVAKMVLDGNNVMTGLTVDGTGGIDFNGLGSVDLTEGGVQTAFEFVTGNMSRTHSVTLTLYDSSADDGTSTSHTFTLAGSTTQTVDFGNFDSNILADVGAVALRVDLLDDEARFDLDNWQVVPEPSTLVLALVAVVVGAACCWLRRRKALAKGPTQACLEQQLMIPLKMQIRQKLQGKSVWRVSFVAAFFVVSLFSATVVEADIITVPTDLNSGDQYRLVFVTSATRDATSTDIADYNNFVTLSAEAVSELDALNIIWRAIGSTATVEALDNTGANPDIETGVPVYRLDGERVADNNAGLWSVDILNPINITEVGQVRNVSVWTGSYHTGQRHGLYPLGSTHDGGLGTGIGRTQAGDSGVTGPWYWINDVSRTNPSSYSLYALSGVLEVAPIPEPATWAMLITGGIGLACYRLRQKRVSTERGKPRPF